MNTSWKNTRKALKNFANVLVCNKCGSEAINATRYTNCGHFFCKKCIENNTVCIKCNLPVQPIEIQNDHMIQSLTSYCNSIAEIIQEKNLWNETTNVLSTSHIPLVTLQSKSEVINQKSNIIPKKNINKPNTKGETILHAACLKNDKEYVKNLLAAGANPNTKDNAGWTPLQEVVNYGHTNICQLLLECGALPNIPGEENRTALHEAAIYNRFEEAKLLLQYSANRDAYDNHGKKPIDYCNSSQEVWKLLTQVYEFNGKPEKIVNHTTNIISISTSNSTLDQSFRNAQSSEFVIYAPNLQEDNNRCLYEMASKHKIKISRVFQPSVTHVIMEANNQNVIPLSYDVMIALLSGKWILNSEWIHLAMDVDDILTVDLELFEISGAPIEDIPKKARENAEKKNPGLFDQCYFYFALHPKKTYTVSNIQLTKDSLKKLVCQGNGSILTREPRLNNIKDTKQLIPFHTANEPSNPLYKCTYYIIYVPGSDEPRVKYNMHHMKTLPLIWLIECIEKFTLLDPSYLGLM